MVMLAKHLPLGTMIEVLIHGDLTLPDDATAICYSEEDARIARDILKQIECPRKVELSDPPGVTHAALLTANRSTISLLKR